MLPPNRRGRWLSLAAAIVLAPSAAAAQVDVTIFHGFVASGGGGPFSAPFCTFSSPGIEFGASTGFDWHPCGVGPDEEYGAMFTGLLGVGVPGTYTFTIVSDDGGQLFIGGALVVDNGGVHPPVAAAGSHTFAAAGLYPFHVDFFECCGGPGGIDLILPAGVGYATPSAVPEPGTLALLAGGALLLAPLARRRR